MKQTRADSANRSTPSTRGGRRITGRRPGRCSRRAWASSFEHGTKKSDQTSKGEESLPTQRSKNSILRESLRNARSGTQSIANLALTVDFLPGSRYHFVGQILGNDDDSVHIRENEISGAHRDAAATDRDVRLHDIHPSERIVRRQSSAE